MKRKIFLGLIFLLLVGTAAFFWNRSQGQKTAIRYQTARVERGDIHVTITSTGVVGPQNRVEVKPPIAGRVEELLVDEGSLVRKGQIIAWMSSTERAALLDSARSEGSGELKRWETLYKPTPIIAPVKGTVILRAVNPGQTVGPTEPAFVLSDRLIVKVQVDETDIAKIRIGQRVTVRLDAYPDQPVRASVSRIAYEAQTVNNVTIYPVDVLPESGADFLRSGMTCNVVFPIESRDNVLVVPALAIVERDGKSWLRVPSDRKNESGLDPIQTGISDGRVTEIISGGTENMQISVPQLRGANGRPRSNPTNPLMPGRRR